MENDFTGMLRSKAAHVAKKTSNISKAEQDGYKWLKKHIDDERIVKGGAILIVDAKLIEEKVQEKLFDKNLYTELKNDPSLLLYD